MKSFPIITVIVMLYILTIGGCGKKYIPRTGIEDTEENRAIVLFCERYRNAVEKLNIGLLLSLASLRYFDNNGTVKVGDDLDRASLEEVLKNRFKAIKTIRYEFRYRNVFVKGNVIYVEYVYTTSYEYKVGGKKRWQIIQPITDLSSSAWTVVT
jgi:hypothetical protein